MASRDEILSREEMLKRYKKYQRKSAASNPIIRSKTFHRIGTFRPGCRYYFSDGKFPPPGVETSDGYSTTEDWELWRITIPPETDSVGWEVEPGYSMEIAITSRGIVAFRKERPRWMMGNRYDSWIELDVDKLNEHLEGIRFIQEQTFEYNLSLIEGEDPMTEAEMAEIMQVSEVAEQKGGGSVLMGEKCQMCKFQRYGRIFAAYGTKSICGECSERKARDGAEQQKKYTDMDMMLKDDEIALLKQQIEHLEREAEELKAALRQVVYDRQIGKNYGVNWKLLQESNAEIDIVRRPTKPEKFERICE